jgi:hypothetical protein
MSGRMLTIKTSDGDYEVPEENAAAAMKLLDAKGVKFDMADLPHEAAGGFSIQRAYRLAGG